MSLGHFKIVQILVVDDDQDRQRKTYANLIIITVALDGTFTNFTERVCNDQHLRTNY